MTALVSIRRFLGAATPQAWLAAARDQLDQILLDHAALELKAAQQGQALMWRYGLAGDQGGHVFPAAFRARLLHVLSRLAREELRHFEQVLTLVHARNLAFTVPSASRYAAGLHGHARSAEPGKLIDSLVIGAFIEARSCERFGVLAEALDGQDRELAKFYRSLLRSEARHYEEYLGLAVMLEGADVEACIERFRGLENELILQPDSQLRFHSGVPLPG